MLNRTKKDVTTKRRKRGDQKPKILNQRAYEQRGNENHVVGPAKPTSSVCRGVTKAARPHMFPALNQAPDLLDPDWLFQLGNMDSKIL